MLLVTLLKAVRLWDSVLISTFNPFGHSLVILCHPRRNQRFLPKFPRHSITALLVRAGYDVIITDLERIRASVAAWWIDDNCHIFVHSQKGSPWSVGAVVRRLDIKLLQYRHRVGVATANHSGFQNTNMSGCGTDEHYLTLIVLTTITQK